MADWIALDATADEPKIKLENSASRVLVSPYDVPEAVRGYIRKEGKKILVIELKYIGSEPKEDLHSSEPDVTFQIGKNSGRVYGLEMYIKDSQTASRRAGAAGIEKALDNLIANPVQKVRLDNYRLVRDAFQSTFDRLLEAATSRIQSPTPTHA